VIGTLFKVQELKPTILKELSEEANMVPQPLRPKYVCSTDVLLLEDGVQRIALETIDVDDLVSGAGRGNLLRKKFLIFFFCTKGVPIAILGLEKEDGKFYVEDWEFVHLRPQPPLPQIDDDQ